MGVCRPSVLRTAGAFFTTAQAVPPPEYRERSEPNSEPQYGGGSVIARSVSSGYPMGNDWSPG